MPDREKVINGLKCIKGDLVLCVDCAYSDGNGHGTYSCKAFCANDAIELLKEQEKSRLEIASEITQGSVLMYQGKQIVRCKDCKHYDIDEQRCLDGLDGIFTPDWFCADGEVKEE